jgi:hypothetical protein
MAAGLTRFARARRTGLAVVWAATAGATVAAGNVIMGA